VCSAAFLNQHQGNKINQQCHLYIRPPNLFLFTVFLAFKSLVKGGSESLLTAASAKSTRFIYGVKL
jgi:hypothetical protein